MVQRGHINGDEGNSGAFLLNADGTATQLKYGTRNLSTTQTDPTNAEAQSSGSSVFSSAVPIALTAADGPILIGYVVGAAILAGATAYDATQRTFVTYTMRNAAGQVYAGRTSGYGDPYRIMMNRYYGHHMRALGYGNPVLDRAVQGYQGYPAIRGREQQLKDFYGGVGSPGVGNSIRSVGYYTDLGQTTHNLSNLYFGPLAPYTGFWEIRLKANEKEIRIFK